MRRLRHIFVGTILALLAACSAQENADIADVGRMDFTLKIDPTEEFAPLGEFALRLSSADGQYSHYWQNYEDFPLFEVFHSGEYIAEVVSGEKGAQGYECQCYAGMSKFELIASATNHVQIDCSLQQAIIAPKYTEGFQLNFPEAKLIAHSYGAEYVDFEPLSQRSLLITPGATSLIVSVKDGINEILISSGLEMATAAAKTYSLTVDSPSADIIQICCGEKTVELSITPELLQSSGPVIEAFGFHPGEPLSLIEGYPAPKGVKMKVASAAPLRQLTLTVIGMEDLMPDFPAQCDLLAENESLKAYGLTVETDGKNATVEFTDLLEKIKVDRSSQLKFMLQACDAAGRLSEVCELETEIKSVDFMVVSYQPAIIGIDEAAVTLLLNTDQIEYSDFEIYGHAEGNDQQQKLEITGAAIDASKQLLTMSVKVPEGINPIPIAIYYMGNERAQGLIPRSVPEFEIVADAFSTSAAILVKAQPAAVREAIVRYGSVWSGGKKLSVNHRLTEEGLITVLGLKPDQTVDLEVMVIEGEPVASARIHTERAMQIPEGDFEEFEQLISYNGMKSGGAYSSSPFPIYNMQNFCNFDVKWPVKYWASTNAKTFCTKASNLNTWYLQPTAWLDMQSAASGSKSVCLSSVGWTLDGPQIEPYLQSDDEYLPYNPNVPLGMHHAAGKMFLGSYTFDPNTGVEIYDEGVEFDCRPTSINGYYKYDADINYPNDKGYMLIELINDDLGEDIIISSAEREFTGAPDFIAFNLPLEYKAIGIKATKLKVFFSSSSQYGDIEHEDQCVPISPWVKESKLVGSMLWIDNLSFSY